MEGFDEDRIDGCLAEDLDRLKGSVNGRRFYVQKVFDHAKTTQLLLSIILERNDLTVHSVEVQKEFQAVVRHSVKFDVFATDEGTGNRMILKFSDATEAQARSVRGTTIRFLIHICWKRARIIKTTGGDICYIYNRKDVLKKRFPDISH